MKKLTAKLVVIFGILGLFGCSSVPYQDNLIESQKDITKVQVAELLGVYPWQIVPSSYKSPSEFYKNTLITPDKSYVLTIRRDFQYKLNGEIVHKFVYVMDIVDWKVGSRWSEKEDAILYWENQDQNICGFPDERGIIPRNLNNIGYIINGYVYTARDSKRLFGELQGKLKSAQKTFWYRYHQYYALVASGELRKGLKLRPCK